MGKTEIGSDASFMNFAMGPSPYKNTPSDDKKGREKTTRRQKRLQQRDETSSTGERPDERPREG